MTKTKIEWATDVWNPTVGCTKVSQGCKNCYAERYFHRFHPEEKFSEVKCYPERLIWPLHWKKPRMVFVDSMSDLFHEDVPSLFIDQVFEMMHFAWWHTFIILTKRTEHMYNYISQRYLPNQRSVLPNVWLITSIEDQPTADERLPWLLKTPAAVRGVSVEPMLGPVDLSPKDHLVELISPWYSKNGFDPTASQKVIDRAHWLFPKIDWVICGCENGPRPMDLDWVRFLRDQCQDAGVLFFLKQARIDGKLVKMPELDGQIWAEYPKIDENQI